MRGLLIRSVAILVLAQSGPRAALAQPSGAPSTRPAASSREELLRQAITHYHRSEFDETRRLLRQLLPTLRGEPSRLAQEVHTYLAFVSVAFGEIEAAVDEFERALEIQPELALPSPPPAIAAALEQARRRYRAKVRALDHDPPRQLHLPALEGRHGQPLTIRNQVTDLSGVRRVVLNYRVRGGRGFASLTMEAERGGGYVATIPAAALVQPGLEYYLEAWDRLGNGPGLKGSPSAPIRIAVRGGPAPPAPTERRPWYKKWWVWAVVAGAAATAGGIGAAAYLTRAETGRVDVRVRQGELRP